MDRDGRRRGRDARDLRRGQRFQPARRPGILARQPRRIEVAQHRRAERWIEPAVIPALGARRGSRHSGPADRATTAGDRGYRDLALRGVEMPGAQTPDRSPAARPASGRLLGRALQVGQMRPGRLGIDVIGRDRRHAAPVVDAGARAAPRVPPGCRLGGAWMFMAGPRTGGRRRWSRA